MYPQKRIDFKKEKYPLKFASFYNDKYYDKKTDSWKQVREYKTDYTLKESLGFGADSFIKTLFSLITIFGFVIIMAFIFFL